MKLQIYSSLPKEKYINKHEFYIRDGPLVGQGVTISLGRYFSTLTKTIWKLIDSREG
jgi:hypothetical protein